MLSTLTFVYFKKKSLVEIALELLIYKAANDLWRGIRIRKKILWQYKKLLRTPVYLTSEHSSAKAAEPKAIAESNVPRCMSGLQRFDVSRIVSQGVFNSQGLPQETIFQDQASERNLGCC